MKRKRHTEEQIIATLKEHEAGMKTAEVCRKRGISEAGFYNGRAKYGGLEVFLIIVENISSLSCVSTLEPFQSSANNERTSSIISWSSSPSKQTTPSRFAIMPASGLA
jgi:hypothetical protein